MPGGRYDSSLTRVKPVFDALQRRDDDWIRALLRLASGGADLQLERLDLRLQEGHWGDGEKGLQPPLSLLDWLIDNVKAPFNLDGQDARRIKLFAKHPETIVEAKERLRTHGARRDWHVFEGFTYPDALLVTNDALIVVEGKRTEAGPTTDTTWMPGRHQIWRHIDAAWEIRGDRRVFGMFIVEAAAGGTDLPAVWQRAIESTRSSSALASSLPHRSESERAALASCFVGGTTWQAVGHHCSLPADCFPDTTSSSEVAPS